MWDLKEVCILGGLMKIQIHCMGNVVPSDFDALRILEPKSQDFLGSVAQIGNIPF